MGLVDIKFEYERETLGNQSQEGEESLKSRKLAAALALLGAVTFPGIHRFYLGQPRWGMVYLLLAWKTPVSRIASLAEALWYLFLEDAVFDASFNVLEGGAIEESSSARWLSPFRRSSVMGLSKGQEPEKVSAIATALRDLEQLRQDGLVTEGEFEQKRQDLLGHSSGRSPSQRGTSLDVNQAALEDWLQLPGLSIHQARILAELSQLGVQFHCLEDLAAALDLSPSQLQHLEPLVQFCYYEDDIPYSAPLRCLDPNQASLEAITGLPGMTPALAQTWLQQRQQSPFQTLPDLGRRLELSAQNVHILMHYLKF